MSDIRKGKALPTVVLSALLAGVLLFLSACSTPTVSSVTRKYVFSVGSEKCPVEEAKILLLQYQKEYASLYGIDLWAHDYGDGDSLEEYVRDLTVSRLAEVYTLDAIAGEQELALTEDEEEQARTAAQAYLDSLSEEELEYLGAGEEDAASLFERYLLAQKLYASLTEDVSREVSDDEARVMEMKQILVSDEETAAQIAEQLEEGADFSSLAETYNESGETDVEVTRTTYDDAVTEALFALNTGEYSGVLEIGDSYAIFYCTNYYNEELTEKNKDNVVEQRMEDAVTSAYSAYQEQLSSALNEKVWAEVAVDTSLELSGSSFGEVYEAYFGSVSF
ncbi:MAG: peptidyl-prolyl cis-trans isomerase [Clostridiales bacterium]|nr:peptidyl-prolyl cis-trans isomerase [Clostridiales bacterium]